MASAAVGPERNEKRTRRFSPGFSGVGPTSTRQSQPWREPRRAMQGHLFPVRMGVCRPRLRFGTDEGRPRGRTASDNESLEQAGAPIPLEGAAPAASIRRCCLGGDAVSNGRDQVDLESSGQAPAHRPPGLIPGGGAWPGRRTPRPRMAPPPSILAPAPPGHPCPGGSPPAWSPPSMTYPVRGRQVG